MSLWDYEAVPNGNKHTILQHYPIKDLFVPFMGSQLRNGIGHHSAVYESEGDEVLYYSYLVDGRFLRLLIMTRIMVMCRSEA